MCAPTRSKYAVWRPECSGLLADRMIRLTQITQRYQLNELGEADIMGFSLVVTITRKTDQAAMNQITTIYL